MKRHFTPGVSAYDGGKAHPLPCRECTRGLTTHCDCELSGTHSLAKLQLVHSVPREPEADTEVRAIFWRSYVATVALVIVCVVILASWPN